MARNNRFQFVAAREDQPGVGVPIASLFTAANADYLPTSLSCTYSKEEFKREVVRSSLSTLTPIAGVVDGTLNITVELAGVTSGVPAWSLLLEACGLQERAIESIAISTITAGGSGIAALFAGEALSGTTGTATAILDTFDGRPTLYVEQGSTPLSGAITGGESGSTEAGAGTGAAAAAGYGWLPTSEQESSCTVGTVAGSIDEGDVLQGDTSGTLIVVTRGSWASASTGHFRYLEGTLIAGEALTNLSQTGSVGGAGVTSFAQVKTPSLTLSFIEDGNRRVMVGCRGKVKFSANQGEPTMIAIEFKGKLAAIPNLDGAEIPGVVYSPTPPSFMGVTSRAGHNSDAYAGEYTARVTAFEFDFATDVAVQRSATEATGLYGAAEMTGRSVSGSLTPPVAPESSFSWLGDLIAGESFRYEVQIGSATGNQFIVQMPACIPNTESVENDNGFAGRRIGFSGSARRPDKVEGADREFALLYLT